MSVRSSSSRPIITRHAVTRARERFSAFADRDRSYVCKVLAGIFHQGSNWHESRIVGDYFRRGFLAETGEEVILGCRKAPEGHVIRTVMTVEQAENNGHHRFEDESA